jgi:hypothetical protein
MRHLSKFHKGKLIIAGAFLLISIHSNSQTVPIENLPQFLFPHFDTAIIKMKTGTRVNAIMNYNTLSEKMTFLQINDLMDLTKAESVDTVYLNHKKFVSVENAFYEVLLKAPVAFFIQHRSEIKSIGRPAALGTTSQTIGSSSVSKLIGKTNSYNLKLPEDQKITPFKIYWVRVNGTFYRFMTTRQFLNLFPVIQDELKLFIKKNRIDINIPEDLLKLGNYCNELTGV